MTDALTDVLDSIRMRGSIFSRAELSSPWGFESGNRPEGMFHAVVKGRAWAQLADGGEPVELGRGDIVLMPFGDNHLMTDAPRGPTRPLTSQTTVDERGMGHLVVEGGGAGTSLICGSVTFDQANPVLSMLPKLIHVQDDTGSLSRIVESIIELIADEVDRHVAGAETVVARLTDVLIVYSLRKYISALPETEVGWLAALRDPAIRDALGLIHRRPDRPWTAEQLASAVGMSRSSFFTRFRQTVGETPGDYLTRWRVYTATRLLREDQLSVAATAHRVGYRTEASFSNAFVRVMGIRPGAYKRAA